MNIIPVLSSDYIGRVIDNRDYPEKKENIRTRYTFYDIPNNFNEIIEVRENVKYVTIAEKKFKLKDNKLMWKNNFLTYLKLYAILFDGKPQVFLLKT